MEINGKKANTGERAHFYFGMNILLESAKQVKAKDKRSKMYKEIKNTMKKFDIPEINMDWGDL